MSWMPKEINNLNKKFELWKIENTKVLGADKPSRVKIGEFFANFKSRGGTLTTVNGELIIIETGDVVTTWRPDIQSDCEIVNCENDKRYSIMGDVEDIEEMHQVLKFKVKRLKGKFNG